MHHWYIDRYLENVTAAGLPVLQEGFDYFKVISPQKSLGSKHILGMALTYSLLVAAILFVADRKKGVGAPKG